MSRLRTVLLLSVATAALVGCDDRLLRTEIGPYLVPCSGYEGQFACLMVREVGAETPYLVSYDGFEGFTHQWGHTSVVEYTTAPVPPPVPEDSPRTVQRLTRVLSDEVVPNGSTFSAIVRDPPPGIAPSVELLNEAEGRFLQGPLFGCATAEVCTELQSLLNGPYEARLQFAFEVGSEVRLVLTGIDPLF